MARYRKVDVAMWGDAKFKALSRLKPSGQSLWVYLLIGPDTSIIPGVIRAGRAGIAESLEWSLEDVTACFAELECSGMAIADWSARVVYLPRGIWRNPPENPNVVRSWRKEFDTIPESSLAALLNDNITDLLTGIDAKLATANKDAWAMRSWYGDMPPQKRDSNGHWIRLDGGAGQPNGLRNGSGNGSANSSGNGSGNGLRNGSVDNAPHVGAQAEPVSLADNGLSSGINNLGDNGTVSGTVPQTVSGTSSSSSSSNRSSNSNSSSSSSSNGAGDADAPPFPQGSPSAHPGGDEEGCVSLIGVSVPEDPQKAVVQEEPVQGFLLEPQELDPVFCALPLVGGAEHLVLESAVRELEQNFEGVNVRAEIRSAKQWLLDNVKRRTTAVGARTFLSSWIRRAQNNLAQMAARGAYAGGSGGQAQGGVTVSPEDYPSALKEFLARYPAGKSDEREVVSVWLERYAKLDDEGLAALGAGLSGWLRSADWIKEGGRFIPSAQRFLREERWRSVPENKHFGGGSREDDEDEARFTGMTLREIKAIKQREADQKQAGGR